MLQYNYLFNILTNNIKQHQRQKHYSSSTYSIRLPQLWHCHIIFIDTNPRVWHFISAWAIWNETTKRTPKVQNSRAAMLGIQSSNLQVAKSNAYIQNETGTQASKDIQRIPNIYRNMGVSKNRGKTPQNGWFIMENPIKIPWVNLGYPPLFFGNTNILLFDSHGWLHIGLLLAAKNL